MDAGIVVLLVSAAVVEVMGSNTVVDDDVAATVDVVASPDVVEVPSGSGRWYQVNLVDDVVKGFTNEYRIATIVKIGQNYGGTAPGLFWPIPMP